MFSLLHKGGLDTSRKYIDFEFVANMQDLNKIGGIELRIPRKAIGKRIFREKCV